MHFWNDKSAFFYLLAVLPARIHNGVLFFKPGSEISTARFDSLTGAHFCVAHSLSDLFPGALERHLAQPWPCASAFLAARFSPFNVCVCVCTLQTICAAFAKAGSSELLLYLWLCDNSKDKKKKKKAIVSF